MNALHLPVVVWLPRLVRVLVRTGVYKEEDLRAASKDPAAAVILPDLTDTESVLKLFLGADA